MMVRREDGSPTGYGKIQNDVFSEFRLGNLPPGVGALIIMFNRNHNASLLPSHSGFWADMSLKQYLADVLLRINERGLWTKEVEWLDDEARALQDHQIFNTARLINSAAFANVVLGDYLAAIMGTVR